MWETIFALAGIGALICAYLAGKYRGRNEGMDATWDTAFARGVEAAIVCVNLKLAEHGIHVQTLGWEPVPPEPRVTSMQDAIHNDLERWADKTGLKESN